MTHGFFGCFMLILYSVLCDNIFFKGLNNSIEKHPRIGINELRIIDQLFFALYREENPYVGQGPNVEIGSGGSRPQS